MATSSSFVPSDWVEPAHPAAIHLYDDYVNIYRLIREKFQTEIDAAFDKLSREIGFVVTMTLPVKIEAVNGASKSVKCGSENLANTLFDQRVISIVSKGIKEKSLTLKDGSYELPIIWFEALKYKFRLDWVEPAHFRVSDKIRNRQYYKVDYEVNEPVHFLTRPDLLDSRTAQVVLALNEVYPELKLSTQMQTARAEVMMKPWLEPAHFHPHWCEPAHPGRDWLEPAHFAAEQPVNYAKSRRLDWVEPAHYRVPREMNDVLTDIASVLKKYGY
jgi:hypothetical protein